MRIRNSKKGAKKRPQRPQWLVVPPPRYLWFMPAHRVEASAAARITQRSARTVARDARRENARLRALLETLQNPPARWPPDSAANDAEAHAPQLLLFVAP